MNNASMISIYNFEYTVWGLRSIKTYDASLFFTRANILKLKIYDNYLVIIAIKGQNINIFSIDSSVRYSFCLFE